MKMTCVAPRPDKMLNVMTPDGMCIVMLHGAMGRLDGKAYMEPMAMSASMASRSAPDPATGGTDALKTVLREEPAFTA